METDRILAADAPEPMPSGFASEQLGNACDRWLRNRENGVGHVRESKVRFIPHTEQQKAAWRQRKTNVITARSHGYHRQPRKKE